MLQNLPHADYWLISWCVFGPNKGLPAWTLIKCFELNWFYATARKRNSFCAITKRPNWKQYWKPRHSNCVRFLTPNNEQRKLNVIKTSNAFVSGFVFEKKMHPTESLWVLVAGRERERRKSITFGRPRRSPTTGMHFVAYSNLQRQIVDNGK